MARIEERPFDRRASTQVVALDGTGDTASIQTAINNLPSGGGEVHIKEGRFGIDESTSINKSNVKIVGSGDATEIFLNANVPDNTYPFHAANVSDIVIKDLKIDGNKANQTINNYGIHFNNVTRGKVTDCFITGMRNHGMWMLTSTDLRISGNVVEECDGYGIYLKTNSHRCFVTGNRVYNTGEFGIVVDGCDYCKVEYNYEEGSGQKGTSLGYGIYIIDSNRNSISGNTTKDDEFYGIILASSANNNTVIGNNVEGSSQFGMTVHNSNNNSITGNTCQENTQHGIYIFQGDNNSITGNTCQDNDVNNTSSSDGIRIFQGDNNVVSSNRCQDNDRNEISVSAASNDNLVVGNNVKGTDHDDTIEDSGTRTVVSDNVV